MKTLVAIVAFMLCVCVLLFSVNFVAYNTAFYDFQFRMNDTAAVMGLSAEELAELRDKVIAYISGRSNVLEIDLFTADELSHMADARAIFIAVRWISWVLVIGCVLALIGLALISKKSGKNFWRGGFAWGNAVFLGIIGVIGLVALIGFSFAFDVFHEILFPQGNWQFPYDSALIQMFPVQVFMSATWVVVGTAVGFAGVSLVAFVMWLWYTSKVERRQG